MWENHYFQPEAKDPVLPSDVVLDIVRKHMPEAAAVCAIDENGGEARTYAIDDEIILKVQRPNRLRTRTSLEREVFFLKLLAKETSVSVPRVLGYGCENTIEYVCMTRMKGVAMCDIALQATEKSAALFELGKALRIIHSVGMEHFSGNKLFPKDSGIEDLKARVKEEFEYIIKRKKVRPSKTKLAEAESIIANALAGLANSDDFVAIHANICLRHTFVNPKTKEYTGLIDFGDAFISHPICDIQSWGNALDMQDIFRGYTQSAPVSNQFQSLFKLVIATTKELENLL